MKNKFSVDEVLIFLPLKNKIYEEGLYNSLYTAITSELVPYEKYTISEIWHHKGYRIYSANSSRVKVGNLKPNKKYYFWNHKKVNKKTYKHYFKTDKILHVDGKYVTMEQASTIIMLNGLSLTIPYKVVDDNFINLKKSRKMKLEILTIQSSKKD